MSGYFIAFEGIDGCGKSTQAKILANKCKQIGLEPVLTREPGATTAGQSIRKILFETELNPLTEAYLFAADRAEHINNVIKPALNSDKVIISDRYLLSSIVYQGIGKGLGVDIIRDINNYAIRGINPDITLILDIPVDMALKRLHNKSRFEYLQLQETVREGFIEEASKDPNLVIVDATGSIDDVTQSIWRHLRFGGNR